MKAVVFKEHGGADVLQWEEAADPKPKNNEVMIRLEAASLNHLDIWVRNGIPAYPVTLPHILGADGAGTVFELGPEAEGISEGDRVLIIPALSCGSCVYCKKGQDNQCDGFEILGARQAGTYGEYVVVPDENVIPIPDNLSFENAAAFPLAYLTAWHMLKTKAQLQPMETLLVVGASAGVAVGAIQIAKAMGARVLAVTSNSEKAEKIQKAGADEVCVSKKNTDFSDWVRTHSNGVGAHVVFEHVGPATFTSSLKSLTRYGRLVTCGATTGATVKIDLRYIFSRDISIMGAKMGTQKEFQKLSNLVFSGAITPIVDKVFPLPEAKEAHSYLEKAQHVGKVILKH